MQTVKHHKKTVIIILAILILCAIIVIISHNQSVADLKKGYLVYSNNNNTLCVYDVENSTEMTYSVDGFSNITNVGKYYGGDFCCIGKNAQSDNNEILLFKDGTLEKTAPIPYKDELLFAVAYNQNVYFSTEEKLYTIDNSNGASILIDDIYSAPFINSKGIVAYLRNDTDLSSEADYSKNTLCIFDNNQIQELGTVDQIICWLSENKILVRTTNVIVTQNSKSSTTQYSSENIIIDILTGEKETTNMFDKTVLQATLSEDNTKAVCWYPMDGSTDMMKLGIYDINNDKNYKSAIGQSSLNTVSSVFVWLDENPMNNYSLT